MEIATKIPGDTIHVYAALIKTRETYGFSHDFQQKGLKHIPSSHIEQKLPEMFSKQFRNNKMLDLLLTSLEILDLAKGVLPHTSVNFMHILINVT